jgi:hypothetical protein
MKTPCKINFGYIFPHKKYKIFNELFLYYLLINENRGKTHLYLLTDILSPHAYFNISIGIVYQTVPNRTIDRTRRT